MSNDSDEMFPSNLHNQKYIDNFNIWLTKPKRSTIDALTEFVSKALPALDNSSNCLAVYLDLSKAFDTIKHSVLIDKLEHYGVQGKALDWFRSYLEQRIC